MKRRMGIPEIKEIDDGEIISTEKFAFDVICFYCHEEIEDEGKVGKGSWMFHKECYDKHENEISKY